MHERPHASHKQHKPPFKAKAEASHVVPHHRSASTGLWHGAEPAVRLGVQRQAVIGEPGDAYEQEADAAAERVVAGEPVPAVSRLPAGDLPTQRQPVDEEDEPIQAWPVQRQIEEEEEEAVQLRPVQRQVEEEEEEPVQTWTVQRQAEEEEEEEAIQAKDTGRTGGTAGRGGITPGMTRAATQAVHTRSPGTPMQPGTRHTLEARFGTNLSDVRVHTDPTAARHAEALRARAFTHRSHIWIGPGESQDDLALMAHETTHVLQQDGVVRRQPREDEEEEPAQATSRLRSASGSPAQQPASTAQRPAGTAGATGAPTVALPSPSPSGTQAPAAAPPARPQQAEPAQAESESAEAETERGREAEGEAPAEPPTESAEAPAPGGDGAAPAAEVELLMPEPPTSLSEEEQARVERVQDRAGTAAERTQDLPPAEAATAEAREAVEEPEQETQARAEGALVETLGERPEPSPEIEELCDRIYRVIRSKRPPDEESLVDADPEDMAQEASGQLESSVEGDTERVAGEYDAMNEAPEGTPQQEPQAMEPPSETVETPNPQATQATPDPVPAEDVSLEADVEASQQRMDDAGMTTEPAELVQSGPVAEARAAQGELEQTAEQGPAEVLAEQEAALAESRADMAALQASALDALTASRQQTVRSGTSQQQGMVGSEEQMRERVSAEAQQIFTDAQTQVNRLLEPLTRTAMSRWETGVARLSTEFRQHLSRVERWIDERHSGLGGAIVGAWDAITGLPDWVVEEYDEAEQAFGDGVCDLIREISTEVNGVIATCEALIEDARTRINELFDSLPAELQEWAAEEQARFGERLDGLHERVQQTQQDFNRDLAQRAAQAVQDVRQEIHELREAAGGLIGRIASAIDAFLEDPVKFIIDGLLELVGIPPSSFWALVNRIQQVIQDIADDPLGFAENLLAAIGQGFEQFFDNIADHLLDGLLDWLFSSLGSVGVEIPTDFSLKSIITFFLQLMGITWARVRRLLAKHIGEENVALIERAYEIVATLIELGPEGLFELLKEHLNPQNILNMVLEAAVEFLIEALIRQVTARILMLFNPVGAILQAIEAIYRVLKWIFENAARIFSLVETVVNGIADILAGNIGGMASAVEQALARLVAPVIDFLAGYVGLGDLPEKIADVIRRMQEWVEGILDRVIGFIANQARRLLSAIGLGEDEEAATSGAYDGQIGKEVTFVAGGEQHRLRIRTEGRNAEVTLASEDKPVHEHLSEYRALAGEIQDEEQRNTILSLITRAQQALTGLDQQADGLADALTNAEQPEALSAQDEAVESAEEQLASLLRQIREALGLVDEHDPDVVKQHVAEDISDIPSRLGSIDTLSNHLQRIFAKRHPEGLKRLYLQPTAGAVEIRAEASASSIVGLATALHNRTRAGATFLIIQIDGVPMTPEGGDMVIWNEGNGGDHAEERLSLIFPAIMQRYQQRYPNVQPRRVEILVRYTPCLGRCTPTILDLQNQYAHMNLEWQIYYVELYEARTHPLANAVAAINQLQGAGIAIDQIERAAAVERVRFEEQQ